MTMKRREFLKQSLAVAGGAMLAGCMDKKTFAAAADGARIVEKATADRSAGFYFPNRAPLQPTAFQKLPTGAVTPKGWIRKQLLLQADGLNGRLPEASDFLKYEGNGWVDANSTNGWEELPYWLKGFGDLGYVLGDQRVIALATKWINGIISSQQPDGWFGPKNLRTSLDGGPDMWPHMPILNALQSFYEYSNDSRVLPFLTKYFQFQTKVTPNQFSKSWAGLRWGDNIESIQWLYNRTGDAWLVDLVKTIHDNSADYTTGIPNWHNVNLSQGFREPAEYWLVSKDAKHLTATYRNYDEFMGKYGQFAGGGFAGDENVRPAYFDPRQGFETCGIVELMHSFEILTRISGDPVWADRNEYIAFNSLPAAFDPQQKVCHYITCANSIQLDDSVKGNDFDNHFAMLALKPGIHEYRCCPHNYGMGWPYYTQEMWLATADNGLCASLYGESEVKAKVGDGTVVTIAQQTDYPFKDTIDMTVTSPKTVSFPLYLRIPGWCASPTIKVNGKAVAITGGAQSYVIVNRAWKSGDRINIHLPMTATVRTWAKNKDSVTVDHGPISYSLAIGEKWTKYDGTDAWPSFAVYATSPWNYGLEVDKANPSHSFDIIRKGGKLNDNPWTHETSPIELRAKARKIPNWQADAHSVVSVLQQSPAKTSEALETITLIPMGAARLRITTFPTVSTGADGHEWEAPHVPDGTVTASRENDDVNALIDGIAPASSYDVAVPRFTWWDHRGGSEWVQVDYKQAKAVSTASVYWFDDTGHGECRVPKSWRLLYKDGDTFKPVETSDVYGTAPDKYNTVTFKPVTTTALKIEVQLQDNVSGGILDLKTDRK